MLATKKTRLKKDIRVVLRKRADKLLQEVNRKEHRRCLACRGPNEVGHHFFTAGSCAELRYEMANIVPLCQSCHLKHHNYAPGLDVLITRIRGDEWRDKLDRRYRDACERLRGGARSRRDKAYYLEVIGMLEERLGTVTVGG